MTVLSDYVARMMAAGMGQEEAMQIVAEVFAAGIANVSARSANAVRQQRYRDRRRNETVTNRNDVTLETTVTNRNETVTNRNVVTSPLSIDNNKKEKKDRGTQISEGWKPDERRWEDAIRVFGPVGADLELRKFAAHHGSKGTVFKNWNLGWDKWAIQAQQWQPSKPTVGVVDPEGVNWRAVLQSYKNYGRWPKGHGNDPTSPACRAPPALLREYGFEPQTTQ